MTKMIDRLGARILGGSQQTSEARSDFEMQAGMRIPSPLSDLLTKIGGAVIFEKGAKFVPSSLSGRENSRGYLSLEVLYGFGIDINGLEKRNAMARGDLPLGVISIGEAAGGDQICLDTENGKILFWKHDVQDNAITEIADNISDFFQSLVPDDIPAASAVSRVKRSFLDF